MHLNLESNLCQKPLLAPAQRLFLSVVSLPFDELANFVKAEAEQNPFLDFEPEANTLPLTGDFPDTVFHFEHLFHQFRLSADSGKILRAGEHIIANIEKDGYLRKPLPEISAESGIPADDIARALKVVQSLEPAGVGARDLRECLLLQIKRYSPGDTLLRTMVEEYWEDMVRRKHGKISAKMNIPLHEVNRSLARIKKFAVAPLSDFSAKNRIFLLSEGRVEAEGDAFRVSVGEKILPFLKINELYERYSGNVFMSSREKIFLEKKIKKARVLIRALSERRRFLTEVFQEIVDCQKDFLCGGTLLPLKEKDIADKKKVSISTVSRAVNRKCLDTPRGVVRLRDFFSPEVKDSLSRHFVLDRMKEILSREKVPLSDREIVERLSGWNIRISVRTVNKYRHMEGILNSYLRQ